MPDELSYRNTSNGDEPSDTEDIEVPFQPDVNDQKVDH